MNSKSILNNFAEKKYFPDQLSICIAILSQYNCRSAEVLSAKWNDFKPGKYLILEGCKGSSNVIIRDKTILESISRLRVLNKTMIFPSVNYYHLYRYCKKYFARNFRKFKKRKYEKVTHGFRYEIVSELDNEKKIRDILHHRSVKSGKYYKTK